MKYIRKILIINILIKLRTIGNPRELAGISGISKRRVYESIKNILVWQNRYDRQKNKSGQFIPCSIY